MPLAFLAIYVFSRLDSSAQADKERAAFDDQYARAQTGGAPPAPLHTLMKQPGDGSVPGRLQHQDGAKVVHCVRRRPGTPDRPEVRKLTGIVASRWPPMRWPFCAARARCRCHAGARVVSTPSMPSVSAASAQTPSCPAQRLGQAQAELLASPAAPLAAPAAGAYRDRGFPARKESRRAAQRLIAPGHGGAAPALHAPLPTCATRPSISSDRICAAMPAAS